MTEDEIEAAARTDPDAQPLTHDQLANLRLVPLARRVRWKLGLSQSGFSERFRIPLHVLRDWERGTEAPDSAAIAYLQVIANEPEAVRRALALAAE